MWRKRKVEGWGTEVVGEGGGGCLRGGQKQMARAYRPKSTEGGGELVMANLAILGLGIPRPKDERDRNLVLACPIL